MIRITLLVLINCYVLTGCNDDTSSNNIQQDTLSVSIVLANLPDTITYNKSTTPDGYVEYKWALTLDMNGDGAINTGDIIIQLHHFKSPGSVETTGTINDFSSGVWLYTTDTQTTSQANVNKTISGNTITFSVAKSQFSPLSDINSATLVYFETSTYNASIGMSEYDYYPSYRTLTSIPNSNSFTDTLNDAAPIIDIQNMSIEY